MVNLCYHWSFSWTKVQKKMKYENYIAIFCIISIKIIKTDIDYGLFLLFLQYDLVTGGSVHWLPVFMYRIVPRWMHPAWF